MALATASPAGSSSVAPLASTTTGSEDRAQQNEGALVVPNQSVVEPADGAPPGQPPPQSQSRPTGQAPQSSMPAPMNAVYPPDSLLSHSADRLLFSASAPPPQADILALNDLLTRSGPLTHPHPPSSSSSSEQRLHRPGLLPSFPTDPLFRSHPHAHDLTLVDTPPPPSSGVPSLVSSPHDFAAHHPSYAASSSLSSALDPLAQQAVLSPPESTASPGQQSTRSAPSPESTLHFSPAALMPPADQSQQPETADGGDAHLMVVGNILQNIAHTAQSAQKACSRGQSDLAHIRIDELKKTISLVSQLIAATRLDDTPTATPSPPDAHLALSSSSSVTMSSPGRMAHPPSFSSLAPGPDTMDVEGENDSARKRCASSTTDEVRVVKALKLEPQPVHIPPPASQPLDVKQPLLGGAFATDPQGMTFIPTPPSSASVASHTHAVGPGPSPPGLAASALGTLPATGFASQQMATSYAPGPWRDRPVVHHRHTVSAGGQANVPGLPSHFGMSGAPSLPLTAPGLFGNAPPLSQVVLNGGGMSPPALNGIRPLLPGGISPPSLTPERPPLARQARSMSMSNPTPNVFAYNVPADAPPIPVSMAMHHDGTAGVGSSAGPSRAASQELLDSDEGTSPYGSQSVSRDRSASRTRRRPSTSHGGLHQQPSLDNLNGAGGGMHGNGAGNEIPLEYRGEVDRVFFEFLNKICSDLDATDSKGEPIHQTLMAKKMQRLDESPDFRPFKFRIAAFTNAFLEELAQQGYPEEIIPMKKIRNYLWNQTYISRFNEEGKKTKSKGNHIWSIDAKRLADGRWIFRPFHRRLAGAPPSVAYVGLRWSWQPRIWDPQNSRTNAPVLYSSPSLPSWLSWEDDVLSGVPPPEAQSCDVTVEARTVQEGQEEMLTQTVHVNIAPMSTVDPFPSMRRPSLSVGNDVDPRRVSSDGSLASAPLRPLMHSVGQPPGAAAVTSAKRETQVVQVLASAAQRVAQEAQSQVVSATFNEPGPELHALAKQQHVLTVTAQAVDQAASGTTQPTTVLAAAAQQVVFQAALQVAADRNAEVASQISAGMVPAETTPAQVTVNDVSVATQTAVAQAVELTGPLSSEVDVLMTASSLLQVRGPDTAQLTAMDATSSLPGTVPSTAPVTPMNPGSLPDYFK